MKTPSSARVACLLVVLTLGCGAPEVQPAPPVSFRCEPLAPEALDVQAPPTLVLAGESGASDESPAPAPPPLCPGGQVPRAVDVPIPVNLGPSSSAGTYYYAGVWKPTSATGNALGVGSRIQIADTAVENWGDQITGEMAIVRGANTSLVEVGYRKWHKAVPTLLLGHWVGGVFDDVTGWIQVHPSYYPGMDLSAYVGMKVRFYILFSGGNWWVWFNDGWMGYFPGSLWNGSFTAGEVAHWYGEVFDSNSRVPPLTDMGNGLFSSDPAAAAMDALCTCSETACGLMSGASTVVTNAAYYTLDYPGGASFRYGGNGGG